MVIIYKHYNHVYITIIIQYINHHDQFHLYSVNLASATRFGSEIRFSAVVHTDDTLISYGNVDPFGVNDRLYAATIMFVSVLALNRPKQSENRPIENLTLLKNRKHVIYS